LQEAKVSLSTVAISKEADLNLLRRLAEKAGGHFYHTEKASDVPRIFSDESKFVSRRATVDHPIRPHLATYVQALAGIDFSGAPTLEGYLSTSLRPGATAVLSIDDKHPLLAYWHYGIGQVFAFASDGDGKWASNWITWD